MKVTGLLLAVFLFVSCARGNKISYTGSTPAANTVRLFLNIPLPDSTDFIRWKITIANGSYDLQCNYGIGKPNTNGFINGGKNIEFSGQVRKENNFYELSYGKRKLKLAILNYDLLQILDSNNNYLTGNGGWSYTLNNVLAPVSAEVQFKAKPVALPDSMTFTGRTPCKIPGMVAAGTNCYKLKWLLVLFADPKTNTPTIYRIRGTGFRQETEKTGTWKIVARDNGTIIYVLDDVKGTEKLYLLKPGENILLFTDADGLPLIGNADFSYTLDRKG